MSSPRSRRSLNSTVFRASSSSESACISGSQALIDGTIEARLRTFLPSPARRTFANTLTTAHCTPRPLRLLFARGSAAVSSRRPAASRQPSSAGDHGDPFPRPASRDVLQRNENAGEVVGGAALDEHRRERPGLEPAAGRRGEVHELALARAAREHARDPSWKVPRRRSPPHARRGPGCGRARSARSRLSAVRTGPQPRQASRRGPPSGRHGYPASGRR